MNYGFVDGSSSRTLKLEPEDEPDRSCIQLYHRVTDAVDLSGKNVLEVGSGRGGGASFVARYFHPAKMVGIDLSQNAVDFSRTRHLVQGLQFEQGDAEYLPFDNESFDVVVNIESSHCYPSLEKFLREVRRVLRNDGYFLYADFRQSSSIDDWRRMLKNSGMTIQREEDITPQVLAALDLDNERKFALIQKLIPRPLRRSFLDFAAVRGTPIYEAFANGRLTYLRLVLQKP